jgi:hypothetical protein
MTMSMVVMNMSELGENFQVLNDMQYLRYTQQRYCCQPKGVKLSRCVQQLEG